MPWGQGWHVNQSLLTADNLLHRAIIPFFLA
jgi:hypothetical protein